MCCVHDSIIFGWKNVIFWRTLTFGQENSICLTATFSNIDDTESQVIFQIEGFVRTVRSVLCICINCCVICDRLLAKTIKWMRLSSFFNWKQQQKWCVHVQYQTMMDIDSWEIWNRRYTQLTTTSYHPVCSLRHIWWGSCDHLFICLAAVAPIFGQNGSRRSW